MKGEHSGFLKSVIEPAGTLRKTNQPVPVTHQTTGAWHRVRGRDLLAFRLGVAKVPGTGLALGPQIAGI
jgi:hypothetical protein